MTKYDLVKKLINTGNPYSEVIVLADGLKCNIEDIVEKDGTIYILDSKNSYKF